MAGAHCTPWGFPWRLWSRGHSTFNGCSLHELVHIIAPCSPGAHSAEFHVAYQKLLHQYDKVTGSCLEAGREISAADQEAVAHMRENGPPPPSPSAKIPVTVPHQGKAWWDKHRR